MAIVEVFAEVGCPFTHLGLRRLVDERQARGRADVALRVRSWPLEVVNGAPLVPAVIADEVAALRAQVAPDLFVGFRVDAFPATSIPALALAAAAYDVSDQVGEAVSLDLRDHLFEHGHDVAADAVLDALAARHGVVRPPAEEGRARVLADHAEGAARGVVGSPHFFVGGESAFCPVLTIHHDDSGFTIDVDPAGFAHLCDLAFG